MTSPAFGFVRYRSRLTLHARWGGYLSLVLLMAVLGGLAIGAVAGARQTQSSFPAFLRSTNPSDLSVGTALFNPALGFTTGYDTATTHAISSLPEVTKAESYVGVYAVPLKPNGTPTAAGISSNFQASGSVDGLFFNLDRATVVRGRAADPRRADELVMTASAAAQLGLHVGQRVPWGVYTLAQAGTGNATPDQVPQIRRPLTLVGIVVLNNAVIQDDADAQNSAIVVLTPAFTRQLIECCSNFSFEYLQLRHHANSVPKVESEIQQVLPPTLPHDYYDPSLDVAKAVHAIKPEAIALAVFGAIAALAALVTCGQLIGRQMRSWSGEAQVLRALGASPIAVLADGLAGVVVAVVIGSLAACAVAVGLSTLFPLGPVRPVYRTPGVSFDWFVLGVGTLVLVGVLSLVAIVTALSVARPRARSSRYRLATGSNVAARASRWGMSAPAATGIRLALGPDAEGTPVRSAILGATLALAVVTSTVVFGASLNSLVAHPSLYGWNWNYELSGGGGVGDIPGQSANAMLGSDKDVAAWSAYYFASLEVDGRVIPVLGGTPGAPIGPPVLSGHGLERADQIVLAEGTLRQIHKTLGDSVVVSAGSSAPMRLRIVGTATMPAIGISGVAGHLSMGDGALVDYELIPPSVRNSFGNSPSGPNAIFVRLTSNASVLAARTRLNQIAGTLSLPTNYGVNLVGVQHPAEIVNYRSMSATPAILGGALAAGAVGALGLTLIASVRRRRSELAVLKTLGFTRSDLRRAIAWQSSIATAIGVVIGVPLGIVLGRLLWMGFARQIYAVPKPDVPALALSAIAVGSLVLANVVAAVPARIAARTPAAFFLRTE